MKKKIVIFTMVFIIFVTSFNATINATMVIENPTTQKVIEYLLVTGGTFMVGKVIKNGIETDFEDLSLSDKINAVHTAITDPFGAKEKHKQWTQGNIENIELLLQPSIVDEITSISSEKKELIEASENNLVLKNVNEDSSTLTTLEKSFLKFLNENIIFLNDGNIKYQETTIINGDAYKTWNVYTVNQIYNKIPLSYVQLFHDYMNDSRELVDIMYKTSNVTTLDYSSVVSVRIKDSYPYQLYNRTYDLSNFDLTGKYWLIQDNVRFYPMLIVSDYELEKSTNPNNDYNGVYAKHANRYYMDGNIKDENVEFHWKSGFNNWYIVASNMDIFDENGNCDYTKLYDPTLLFGETTSIPVISGINKNINESDTTVLAVSDSSVVIPAPADAGITESDIQDAINQMMDNTTSEINGLLSPLIEIKNMIKNAFVIDKDRLMAAIDEMGYTDVAMQKFQPFFDIMYLFIDLDTTLDESVPIFYITLPDWLGSVTVAFLDLTYVEPVAKWAKPILAAVIWVRFAMWFVTLLQPKASI